MKSKKKGLIVFFSLVLIILLLTSNVFATELEVSEYSKKYQEWLELSEEERKGKIAPLPFNVREENTGFFAKLKSYAKSIIIPEKYDLRDDIYVEVKNQQDTGECWAFAANSSVETNLALKNGENKNFSERHVEYDTVLNFLDGINENGFNRKPGNGGTISTAFAYYSRGSGPIPEEYMPFENNENVINLYELPQNVAEKKVDDMIYFPNLLKKHDENGNLMYFDADYNLYTESEVKIIRNKIKEHIMENGGLVTSIVGPNCYYNELTYAANVVDIVDTNHAVTIIGWDDNFPKENFLDQPSEDGAYIVLNSWGEEWGDNGIYYISYEDYNVESWLRGVTSVSDIEYDNLYQHDTNEMAVCFPSITYSANVFESEENEILTEIMIGSLGTQTCNIYYGLDGVLDKDFLTKIASNVELKSGYNTIKLNKEIKIEKGRKFSIVVEEISNSSSAGVGLESNQTIFGNSTNNMGESYISANGYGWSDLYYYEYDKINLSIKAFTKLDKKSFEVSEINGKAYANYGGEFTFSVSTTYEKVGENLKISIYKDDIDVTEQFNFINTEIKGKGSFTKINALESVQRGNYKAIISLDGFEKVDRYFEVDEIDGECIVAEFKDEEFFNWCKNIMKNTISELDNPMRIIALKSEFEKVEELYPYGNIYDITGVEKFTNLKILNIYNTFVSDLSCVEELDKLEELILGRYSSNADISKLLEKENLNIYFLESRDIYAKDIIKPTKNEIELSNPIYQILSTQKDLNIEAYIYYDLFDEFKIGNSMLIADSNNREKAEIELKDGKAVVKLDNTITENRSERIRMIEISLTNEKVWSFVCLAYEVIEGLKDIEKIEINSNPLKLTYIKGEELDLTGGVLEVTYEDGSKTKVKMINEEVTVIGYDKNTLGEQEI